MSETISDYRPRLAWYENNPGFTGPISKFLEEYFNVQVFGVEGKPEDKIIEFKPEIIIFDYRMPFVSGIDMYLRLKKRNLQFIPVFYTIWAHDDVTRQKVLDTGIEKHAIIDKHMHCKSFVERIVAYYRSHINDAHKL